MWVYTHVHLLKHTHIISLLTGKLRKARGDSGGRREKRTKTERFKIQQWQLLEMPRGEWEVTGFTEKMAIDNKGREKCSLHLEMKTPVKSHLYFNCPWEHYHRNGKEVAMRWARRQRHRPKAARWDLSTSSGPALSHPQPQGKRKPFLTNVLAAGTTGSKTEREREKQAKRNYKQWERKTVHSRILPCIISTQA